MGEKILKYYKFVSDQMGLDGKVKLAQATKIPSINAAMIEDSPVNLKLFVDAITKITGKAPPAV